jgi:polysaccharide pyruvyl transferase WcaK-like protein
MIGDSNRRTLHRRVSNRFLAHYNSAPWSRRPLSLNAPTGPRDHVSPPLVHIANFAPNNAGDRLLPLTVRDAVDSISEPQRWTVRHAHRPMDKQALSRMNASRGVVIGGGGLFLRDTNPNDLSGWQWSCSVSDLAQIEVPIIVTAVGYNRFRGQPDFAPVFRDHLQLLVEKSAFIGIRNNGSIQALRTYLPEDLWSKVELQPCYTTVLSDLYPTEIEALPPNPEWTVGFNCAFDREDLRYGERRDEILSAIAEAAKQLSTDFPIRYLSHSDTDEKMLPYLDAAEVPYRCIRMNWMSPKDIMRCYGSPMLTIGMRGHSQMIPAGLLRPIISVASHEKMWYFLQDIGATEWGVETSDTDLTAVLVGKARSLLGSWDETQNRLKEIERSNFRITQRNLAKIEQALGLGAV